MVEGNERFNLNTAINPGAEATTYDEGLRQHMVRIYNTMAAGLGITGLVAYALFASGLVRFMMTPIASFALLGAMLLFMFVGLNPNKMAGKTVGALRFNFFAFSALLGAMAATWFVIYSGQSIAKVFFITGAMFMGMSLCGNSTKRDLTSMGSFLVMGVIGLVIAMVVNMFLKSSGLQFVISCAGVLIYLGLTAYDTQNIKRLYNANHGGDMNDKLAVFGALSLYMNFINLMQFLLSLLGNRNN